MIQYLSQEIPGTGTVLNILAPGRQVTLAECAQVILGVGGGEVLEGGQCPLKGRQTCEKRSHCWCTSYPCCMGRLSPVRKSVFYYYIGTPPHAKKSTLVPNGWGRPPSPPPDTGLFSDIRTVDKAPPPLPTFPNPVAPGRF